MSFYRFVPYSCGYYFAAAQEEVAPQQPEAHSEEKDVKHVILPITETHLPIYHPDSEHYPVIIKTEDVLRVPGPAVILEEKPPVEPQTVADDHLPTQQEQQSYNVHETGVEAVAQENIGDHNIIDNRIVDQDVSHSQEEIPSTALYEPDNIHEQTQDEQIQEEEEEMRVEQIREEASHIPVPDQEQIASEFAEDSAGFVQESAPDSTQEPDEFYTPEEQLIPQSDAYAQEYQEESYQDNVLVTSDSHEPWVMVDYPPAEEQGSHVNRDDSESQQVQQEMAYDRFAPQAAEQEEEYQYYADDQRIDTEEIDEEQPVEVCTTVV